MIERGFVVRLGTNIYKNEFENQCVRHELQLMPPKKDLL